ncbi:MAG: Serine/threonine-protein kinase PrkC [Acidobacteriota bacterium]
MTPRRWAAVRVIARSLAENPGIIATLSLQLVPGTRLGAYEITVAIGAGGMGEVYRARDTKLGREVALKILPESVVSDRDRTARFRREAQVLAALNHPAIAAIYGFEESGATHFLVLELVEGGTLADRLVRGAVSIDEAIHIARQLADALEAAHEKGIIHRDLKPANIALTANDQVKVLDFGLAKAMDQGSGIGDQGSEVLANSPTMASPPAMTQAGMIIGTAAYMSPEQAKGRVADKRSDVWSFGCVLYEMLTGRTAFPGDDVLDTLTAVMRSEPDWSALPTGTPARLRTLLERCLKKDRKDRIADIAVAQFLLNEPPASGDTVTVGPPVAPAPARWRLAAGTAAIALVAVAIGGAAGWRFAPATTPIVAHLSFPLPEGQRLTRIGHQSVAISPDGTQVVYVADGRLYLRPIAEATAKEIPGTNTGAEHPAFSPDGSSLVFSSRAEGVLKRIALTGGAPVTICPAGAVLGLSWAHDGSILFAQEQGARGVLRVSADGGTPAVVIDVKVREQAHGPQLLPDGEHVLFTLATGTGANRWNNADIVVQSLRSGERKTLVTGGTDGRYLASGHLVYGLGGVLLAVAFDDKSLTLAGGPVAVVEGVRASGSLSGSMQFSVSDTGSLVYLPGRVGPAGGAQELALADRTGRVERIKLPGADYTTPRASPDGASLAVGIDDGKVSDIWIYELAGTTAIRRLTSGGHNERPVWSADSRRIAYQSDRDGDEGLFWQLADGTAVAERLTTPEPGTSHAPESWSPDGATILFSATTGPHTSLWTLSLAGRKVAPFGAVHSAEPTNAVFSRDGRWVAYSSTEGGRRILVQPFPATGAKYEVAAEGIYPQWSTDGSELLWSGAGRIDAVRVKTQPGFSVGNPVAMPLPLIVPGPSLPRSYDVTPAGTFVGLVAPESARTAAPIPPVFQVVLNWFEELKTQVPTR